jgi:hypothetical protein
MSIGTVIRIKIYSMYNYNNSLYLLLDELQIQSVVWDDISSLLFPPR